MVYKNAQLLLHSPFMLCMVKKLLKGEVGGCALNSHGNYIVDHGKSWKNHGIVLMNFCGNPGKNSLFPKGFPGFSDTEIVHMEITCSCICL